MPNKKIENSLANALIQEAIHNPEIKQSLHQIANQALKKILNPFFQIVFERVDSFKNCDESIKKALNYLADKHISAKIQFGGLLPQFKTKEEITNSFDNIILLFQSMASCLENTKNIENGEQFLRVMKCLADLGWCYVECLPELRQKNYALIKDMVWPTDEEFFDARIRRSEQGELLFARTLGIGTKLFKDVVPDGFGRERCWEAGKSIFAGVNMEKRFELLCKRYDQLLPEYQALLEKKAKNPTPEIQEKISELNKTLIPLQKKMQYYKIPLAVNSRLPLALYAQHFKPWFQKLADLPMRNGKSSLPLIASISGSSARTLIALQDQDGFVNDKNQYNLDAMQMFSNCLAAYYIYCGHHSLFEVAEVHNRFLDYIGIYDAARLPFVRANADENHPYFTTKQKVEDELPYFHIGDYKSFLHASYAGRISPEKAEITHQTSFRA